MTISPQWKNAGTTRTVNGESPGGPSGPSKNALWPQSDNTANGTDGVRTPSGPSRENYRTKGERYLLEGRLTITAITPTMVTALVKGAGEIYTVTATADRWTCTCMAKGPCCHIWAAQLVTIRPKAKP